MEDFKSINVHDLGVNLEKMGDFLYHEGPLLSLFRDRANSDNYYFYKWADSDDFANRWLVFAVKKENLRRFLFKEVSLKQLINLNTFVFFVDINDDLNPTQYLIASLDDFPASYLPTDNSFYKEGKYTELAESVKSTILTDDNTVKSAINTLISEVGFLKKEQNKLLHLISEMSTNKSQKPLSQAVV
jgi:hypothetical protein